MLIHVDRASVAAGDDAMPHDYTLEAEATETLGALLGRLEPDVSVNGPATWAVRLSSGPGSGEYVAAYAAELGGMRVVRHVDRTLGSLGTPHLYFAYFAAAPGELLLGQIERGETPDPIALRQEGWRRHLVREENDARTYRAGRKLLSDPTIAAVTELGGQVSAHSDIYARIDSHAATWLVRRNDWWHNLSRFDSGTGLDELLAMFKRPGAALAEPFLVCCVGAAQRTAVGLPPLQLPPRVSPVHQWGQWHWAWPGPDGPLEAQSINADIATLAACVAGLSVAEVVAVLR